MPTANPIVANKIKTTSTVTSVKQEPTTLKTSATTTTSSAIHTHPAAATSLQVPTPVLQPAVSIQVHKPVSVANPVKIASSVPRTVMTRTPGVVHNSTVAASTVAVALSTQRAIKPSSPRSKKKKTTVTMATAQSAQSSTQGENTGRWTAEEHRLFLQGLEQHGKGWKKIASLIKSRTVVQIRTHAQKYFQKLAKARQNGEEGEVGMENRERLVVSGTVKRRRSGTKRKAIASVVASAERESKKAAATKAKNTTNSTGAASNNQESASVPISLLPAVAPALTPYVYPMSVSQTTDTVPHCIVGSDGNVTPTEPTPIAVQGSVPSITTSHGTISGAALEESLFRYLTPMTVVESTHIQSGTQVNDVARQAGANPITVPTISKTVQPHFGGDVSPTGVADFPTNWAWSNEAPTWFAKGADVDELLNEADALDWLADSGDLGETYNPPPDHSLITTITATTNTIASTEPSPIPFIVPSLPDEKPKLVSVPTPVPVQAPLIPTPVPATSEPSIDLMPQVKAHLTPSNSGNIPPLPSLFESNTNLSDMKKEKSMNLSSGSLFSPTSGTGDVGMDENFNVLDDQHMDEQAFVTALLDHNNDSMGNLACRGDFICK